MSVCAVGQHVDLASFAVIQDCLRSKARKRHDCSRKQLVRLMDVDGLVEAAFGIASVDFVSHCL